jgi:hypothetical protein
MLHWLCDGLHRADPPLVRRTHRPPPCRLARRSPSFDRPYPLLRRGGGGGGGRQRAAMVQAAAVSSALALPREAARLSPDELRLEAEELQAGCAAAQVRPHRR